MAKKEGAMYVVIRLDLEYDESLSENEVVEIVQAEMDYSIKYKTDSIEITSTEVCGVNEWI